MDKPPSIDPTIASTSLGRVRSLEELTISTDCVYLFDFDGVIASRMEDDIYKLAPSPEEGPFLAKAAEYLRIKCQDMEMRYQRHLLYQAAAHHLHIPIEQGPAFLKAKEAGNRARLFILTARSGWHAVERMRQFVIAHKIRPIEIFNVGRARKDRQIDLVCREFIGRQIFFVEDSLAHLADASSIAANNLYLTHVEPALQPPRAAPYLRSHANEVLASAVAAIQRAETSNVGQR